jgi:RHO1 GDP-GTP exchange protein 1/2
LLLFSAEFVEIRSLATGKLVQVIEGFDIRLVHASERSILVVMRGSGDKHGDGAGEKLVELVETVDLATQQQSTNTPGLWDEWDM